MRGRLAPLVAMLAVMAAALSSAAPVGASRARPAAPADHAPVDLARAAAAANQTAASQAADSTLDARVREVASRLRCPFCEGLSIEASPDASAREMRDVIRDQLAAGRTEAEVEAYFVERYGEWVLMQPSRSGFNLLVYALPAAALLAGAALLLLAVRRWSAQAREASGETGPDTIDAEDPDLAPWDEIRR